MASIVHNFTNRGDAFLLYHAIVAVRNTMQSWAQKKGWLIPILLCLSLAANILGLILPFLELDKAFSDKIIYSLPHSVHLMWESKLYIISILILSFSIIFPFVKLFSLFAAWFLPWKSTTRATFLHWIELLGKWSYMDIFVVILLLALTNNQTMISSKIHSGVYFFIGAITLSMFVSQMVLGMARKIVVEEHGKQVYPPKKRWMLFDQLYLGWTVPLLVIVSAAALVESIHATFLQISQFFLVSRSYSIFDIIELLQTNKHWILLIVIVGTIIAIPLIRLAFLLVVWIIPMQVSTHIRARQILEGLSRWSMLDVFGIALFLIASEGKDLVNTKVQPGLYIVVIAIALSYILGFVAVALHKVMIKLATSQP
ncbi:MAG: paraquat-inducible protein A [Planctomycetes bacterium]|nr:paraquat-inducible protein A [Planctomycetota bacterium]